MPPTPNFDEIGPVVLPLNVLVGKNNCSILLGIPKYKYNDQIDGIRVALINIFTSSSRYFRSKNAREVFTDIALYFNFLLLE